jgi:hypothetical protein
MLVRCSVAILILIVSYKPPDIEAYQVRFFNFKNCLN